MAARHDSIHLQVKLYTSTPTIHAYVYVLCFSNVMCCNLYMRCIQNRFEGQRRRTTTTTATLPLYSTSRPRGVHMLAASINSCSQTVRCWTRLWSRSLLNLLWGPCTCCVGSCLASCLQARVLERCFSVSVLLNRLVVYWWSKKKVCQTHHAQGVHELEACINSHSIHNAIFNSYVFF